MRSESLFPMPVSTRTVCVPVRMSSELSPAVTQFLSSTPKSDPKAAATLRDHITLGTTPKSAPPSRGYVPSEKMLSSKLPSVNRCIRQCATRGISFFTTEKQSHGGEQNEGRLSRYLR